MKPILITKESRQDLPWLITSNTTAIARRSLGLPAVMRSAPVGALTIRERGAPVPMPALPPKQTYTAETGEGFVSRLLGVGLDRGRIIEIELPFGTRCEERRVGK